MRLLVVIALVFICGCSSAELRREFIGMSVQDVTGAHMNYIRTFDKTPAQCLEKTLAFLKSVKTVIMTKDEKRRFIVADRFDNTYKTCIDTTQVGIVIIPLETNKAQVVVASENSHLAELVSIDLFSYLGKVEPAPEKANPVKQKE